MVVTDRFVYIHMPKTGGTFVTAALRKIIPLVGAVEVDTSAADDSLRMGFESKHQTVSDIPAEYRDRPIVATIRNPYDHYVSFYEFGWWRNNPGDTFDDAAIRRHLPKFPDISFAEYLLAQFDWRLLDRQYITDSVASDLRDAGAGPLTYDYIRFFFRDPERVIRQLPRQPDRPAVRFLRTESLNRDYTAIWKRLAIRRRRSHRSSNSKRSTHMGAAIERMLAGRTTTRQP